MTFTNGERAYLADQHLGRLATVGPDGAPQVNPVTFWVNGDSIEIGGPSLSRSRKFRNIQADPRISFVVDDNAREPVGPGGQRGRGLEIRGKAELVVLDQPLMSGFSNDMIRVHPHRIIAWNLEGPGANTRDVEVDAPANVNE
jgi:pyridoxamine 5'-phosphate oxidase family protein